jgi:hypothetical protein
LPGPAEKILHLDGCVPMKSSHGGRRRRYQLQRILRGKAAVFKICDGIEPK